MAIVSLAHLAVGLAAAPAFSSGAIGGHVGDALSPDESGSVLARFRSHVMGARSDGSGAQSPGVAQPGDDPERITIPVSLVPEVSASGIERVNFGVPLPRRALDDPNELKIESASGQLPAYVRPIAWYPDGSFRSVQVQVDVDLSESATLDITIGAPATAGALEPVPIEDTLVTADGAEGPRVLALLPPDWLVKSGLVGPLPSAPPGGGASLGEWEGVCNYDRYDTSNFLSSRGDRGAWLYDRPTALFRLHAITGDPSALRSAFREAHVYRASVSGRGESARIGVPTATNDLKYHYTQGMAIAYLLSGDERLRERVEDVATRAAGLWRPHYTPGGRFWTERHAAFGLLAYVWAARVSDERRHEFLGLADEAVDAYLDTQLTHPRDFASDDARCFSHNASDAGESYGGSGCSPWLSAILADGLAEYAAERGGERAKRARESIVRLGRFFARYGADPRGKPYFWLDGDGSSGREDPGDEHWGEMPYVIAMAWHYDGRRDDSLRQVAEDFIEGLAKHGVAPHIRSFNWQCRSAPLTPYYLE